MMRYNPAEIEPKWQQLWRDTGLYDTDSQHGGEPYYQLTMFPYPSGDLHAGHWYAFTGADVLARWQRMQGKQVLFPMGWDAFGLPAENAAIKRGIAPAEWTRSNIAAMKQQIQRMGASFDWSKELSTAHPDYYRWTQWLFLLLYENGLAYRETGWQNWCPSCQTVLANEQVVGVDNLCERCDTPVEKKELEQWFFKITEYAEELLQGLDELDWPERIKTMQRNWIGKSEGANIVFPLVDSEEQLEVYTTRPDTLFGATFMVLAPEHPILERIVTQEQWAAVDAYKQKVAHKTELERIEEVKDKSGVFTGAYARNPATNEQIPIWAADYVLMGYGSGAIMAVPAHDRRDYEFAEAHDLPITPVIEPQTVADIETGVAREDDEKEQTVGEVAAAVRNADTPFDGNGIMINSQQYSGLRSEEAKRRITEDLQSQGKAEFSTQYKLRDWLISRQRYWGAPIPVVYCESCGIVAVDDNDLPVRLPEDVAFTPSGRSPLHEREDFVSASCPQCDEPARREVDTMDTFVDSSWYFLRFPSVARSDVAFDTEVTHRWLPVDHYTGGIEHAILHLLYARFITKVLRDYAGLEFDEPFLKLTSQGIILGPDGNKMSKSRGNVVSPDYVLDSGYGADAFRTYLLFIGPWTDGGPFSHEGITGVYRFLSRVWQLLQDYQNSSSHSTDHRAKLETRLETAQHQVVKKVSQDIASGVHFNTAIAALMEYVNELFKISTDLPPSHENTSWSEAIGVLLRLLAPFAPHLSEELWTQIGNHDSVHIQPWPEYDESKLNTDTVNVVVQVNGKVRERILVDAGLDEHGLIEQAQQAAKVASELEKKQVVKTVAVPNKLVNFVTD